MFLLKRVVTFAVILLALAVAVPFLNSTTPLATTLSVRGVYGHDTSATGKDNIKATGFNTVIAGPYRTELDTLQSMGMKGLVWLWGYDNSTCSFNASDDKIRQYVSAVAGHPAIAAYQIDDEPSTARTHGCPNVADQIRARTQLLHQLDPATPTYVVISTWDGVEKYPYQYFAGTTDIMGLDVYPFATSGTHLSMISSAIAEADLDGVAHYWAVMQDFSDGYYVLPTATQVQQQFDLWLPSRMEGYFVYHWGIANMDSLPDHRAVYSAMNALLSGTGTPAPSPSPSTSPTQTSTPAPVASPTPTADTTSPTVPGDLSVSWTRSRVRLKWTASSDNVGVAGYRVYRDGILLKTTTKTWTNDRPSTTESHLYRVVAFDAAGNVSGGAEVLLAPLPTATSQLSTAPSRHKHSRA